MLKKNHVKEKKNVKCCKKKDFHLPFTDRRNPTILVYKKGVLKNFANVTGKSLY